jgi:hypothetical protein
MTAAHRKRPEATGNGTRVPETRRIGILICQLIWRNATAARGSALRASCYGQCHASVVGDGTTAHAPHIPETDIHVGIIGNPAMPSSAPEARVKQKCLCSCQTGTGLPVLDKIGPIRGGISSISQLLAARPQKRVLSGRSQARHSCLRWWRALCRSSNGRNSGHSSGD